MSVRVCLFERSSNVCVKYCVLTDRYRCVRVSAPFNICETQYPSGLGTAAACGCRWFTCASIRNGTLPNWFKRAHTISLICISIDVRIRLRLSLIPIWHASTPNKHIHLAVRPGYAEWSTGTNTRARTRERTKRYMYGLEINIFALFDRWRVCVSTLNSQFMQIPAKWMCIQPGNDHFPVVRRSHLHTQRTGWCGLMCVRNWFQQFPLGANLALIYGRKHINGILKMCCGILVRWRLR